MTDGEVLTSTTGHRPVCECGWVAAPYPLGFLDAARAALKDHQAHGLAHICHEEIADRDGWAEPCARPATGTRTDDEGHQYPVCPTHDPTCKEN